VSFGFFSPFAKSSASGQFLISTDSNVTSPTVRSSFCDSGLKESVRSNFWTSFFPAATGRRRGAEDENDGEEGDNARVRFI